MIKNKRGQGIDLKVIIGLLILIAGVIVIFIFYSQLELSKIRDEEICHTSVVTRSSKVLSLSKDLIPLNCKTNYRCLSGDGTCEKMTSPDEIILVKTKEDVFYNLAELMSNCWWVYGEGGMNYVGDGFDSELFCSICSQVAFDDSVQDIVGGTMLDKQEFMNYLSNTDISDKEKTYAEYFYGTNKVNELTKSSLNIEDNTEQVESVCNSFCAIQDAEAYCIKERILKSGTYKMLGSCYAYSKTGKYNISECTGLCSSGTSLDIGITSINSEEKTLDMGSIDLTKQQYIMMGIFNEISVLGWAAAGAGIGAATTTAVAIAILSGGTALPVSMSIIALAGGAAGGTGTYFIATTVKGDSGQEYLTPTIVEANSEQFDNLRCESIVTLS